MPIRKLLLAGLVAVAIAGCSGGRPQAVPVPAGPPPALAAPGEAPHVETGPFPTPVLSPQPSLPVEPGSARAANQANLRSGPGTMYPVTGKVEAGQALSIVACNSGRTWYQLADGEWITAELVSGAPRALQVALEIPTPPPPSPSPVASATRPTPTRVPTPRPTPAPIATVPAAMSGTAAPTTPHAAGGDLCPPWQRQPRPGYAMLIVENHHRESISLTAAGGATWDIPGKIGETPGRWYAELAPGRHDFGFTGSRSSGVTPGRFTATVEADASYIVPLWSNGGGEYYVYQVEVPANCK